MAAGVRFPDAFREEWDWDHIASRQLAQRPQELLDLLIGLIESDDYRARLEESDEAKLLRGSVLATGGHGWHELMNRLEAGSRLSGRLVQPPSCSDSH